MPRTTRNALTVLASALIGAVVLVSQGGPARGQAAPSRPVSSAGPTGVRDRAGMFTPEAVAQAEKQLRETENEGRAHWQVLIETLDTLGGKSPGDASDAIIQAEKLKGVLVLMAKKEHHVWVFPTKEAAQVFSDREKSSIVDLVTQSFKKGEFDKGLLTASAELRRAGIGFGVRDRGTMFSTESALKADAALERIHKQTGWDIVVETVASLKGAKAADVALANAKGLNIHGLYILISKADKAIQTEPSNKAKPTFTTEKIRQAESVMKAAFRSGDADKGLLDAVEGLRATAESAPDRAAKPVVVARAPDAPATTKMHLPGPGDPPSKPSTASTPPPTPIPPVPPAPPAEPPGNADAPPLKATNMMPFVLLGGGVLFFLWIVKRVFRRAPQQNPNTGGYNPAQGYQPQPQPQPGYAPQRPAQGYGYGPQQPAPGYGPVPQQGGGGGGFMTGMLGGLGGSILGNVIYDHLGRPVTPETHPHGYVPPQNPGQMPIPGGQSPTQGGNWSAPAVDPNTGQPTESYDPNAGVGTTWGEPESAPASEPVGGDWGAPEPQQSEPASGDWGGGNDDNGAGGDWGGGGGAEPAPDSGNGGDWGGDAGGDGGGGGDAGTGGDW